MNRYENYFTNPQSDLRLRHDGDLTTTGCSITGSTFNNPATVQFPGGYVGNSLQRVDKEVRSHERQGCWVCYRFGRTRRPQGEQGRQPLLPNSGSRSRYGLDQQGTLHRQLAAAIRGSTGTLVGYERRPLVSYPDEVFPSRFEAHVEEARSFRLWGPAVRVVTIL